MSDSSDQKRSPIEIVTDEDWKTRVKAEDAKLDQETEQQSNAQPEFDPSMLPQASFAMLVQMFTAQALVALGVIPGPDQQVQQQLPLARHFIDLLGVLDEKCRGNLSDDEEQLLKEALQELRMAFVEVSKQQ